MHMRSLVLSLLSLLALAGCGSMSHVGPLYQENSKTCLQKPCTQDSDTIEFAKEKLSSYAAHFSQLADERADSNLRAGNLVITGSVLGLVSGLAQSREGIIGSAVLGIPPALFMQRYNLQGQTQIYLRGVRNFQCMGGTVRDLQNFQALYRRVPETDRTDELREANQSVLKGRGEVDQRIRDVVTRTRVDLINGVGAVDSAAISRSFEQYAKDLASAQERIRAVPLLRAPAAAGTALPLTPDETLELRGYVARLKILGSELDKCVAL